MIDAVTKDTEYELKELEPFVNYSIYVSVFSSAGAGQTSETIVVQTQEDGELLLLYFLDYKTGHFPFMPIP